MTIKIFLLLMIFSVPDMPSVKYNALIYPTETQCLKARDGYLEAYEEKPLEYKKSLLTEAHCIEFESFPITGMLSGIGA